jgi:LacI family transcriptional regulator
MPITIRNLAKKLNLSITTVSRALDGYADVSAETRQRVIQAAEEMGYRPSYIARNLRKRRSDSIGYILPTASPQFSDPFYTSFLTGLCDESATRRIDLLVASAPPSTRQEQEQYQRWVLSGRVDGVVLNRIRRQDWRIEFLEEQKLPFAGLGTSLSSELYPRVEVDERGGMTRLTRHLIEQGHRRIAFIGGPAELSLQFERSGGYRRALQEAGIMHDPQLEVEGDLSEQRGYELALQLLNSPAPPTALIGCNDLTALGAHRAAKDMNLNIGEEIAIAGFDGLPETEFIAPPITTLVQPTYEIARRLAGLLIDQINGAVLECIVERIEPILELRASTG